MAFPDTTPTTPDSAFSLLYNRLVEAGMTIPSTLDKFGVRDAALANMLASLPNATTIGRAATVGPGAGITTGVGTICETSIVAAASGIITTSILMDLTGLASAAAADVIGAAAGGAAYICQIPTASGTIMGGTLRCYEAPAGGEADIDVYSATVATGEYDDAVSGLTGQTQAVNAGTLALTTDASVIADTIVAGDYLYLVSVGATAAAYTAGRIHLVLYGV